MESCFLCLWDYDYPRHLWSSPGLSHFLYFSLSDFPLDSSLLIEETWWVLAFLAQKVVYRRRLSCSSLKLYFVCFTPSANLLTSSQGCFVSIIMVCFLGGD